MQVFVGKKVHITMNEAVKRFPNSAILMINAEPCFRDVPKYGRVMSDMIGDLIAVAENDEADLACFDEMHRKFSKPENNIYIFYNFPYRETLEEYMENYKDVNNGGDSDANILNNR